jgi:hypothetical protein
MPVLCMSGSYCVNANVDICLCAGFKLVGKNCMPIISQLLHLLARYSGNAVSTGLRGISSTEGALKQD